MKKKTTFQFIEEAKLMHGDKYDYSKVKYVNAHTKVCIICPKHGEFWQTPDSHLHSNGCKMCATEKNAAKNTKTTLQFIAEAKLIHGDKYDYSKVVYINAYTKVCIICPIHGEFWQTPHSHLSGQGCSKCYGRNKTTLQFIAEAKLIHGEKYDYSKTDYVDAYTKVCIICPKHGEFWQTPHSHLSGRGCNKCSIEKQIIAQTMDVNIFIERANKIHNNKYDYSKVKYINNHTKVCIICPKHGEFWQTPQNHLSGKGCKKCSQSHLEIEIEQLLKENNIKYEYNCFYNFLNGLQLDFYIPDLNIAIECQGKQHFKIGNWSKDENTNIENFNKIKERDQIKYNLCKQKNITLLYYSNLGIEYPYEVIEDKNKILNIIQECQRNLKLK